jgi:hypothetical protein
MPLNVCHCCLCKKELNIEESYLAEDPTETIVYDGTMFKISPQYGSKFDMQSIVLSLCDECLEHVIQES